MVIIEKRTERIKFWLTDKELKQIDRKAGKLGMNRSEYIRHLIANCKLVHTPSIDYEGYVVESKFQKPDYKKPNKNILLNNRIGNYLTSDFADLPSVGTSNIISTEYDCTAAGKEDNNAAEKE